jgi:thiol-disulfide isomerase/thioredoxin
VKPCSAPVPHILPRRDALALLGGAAAAAAWPGCAQAAPAERGQPVAWPEVALLDGGRWGAVQAQDKAVIVVFWSTTCPFCLRHNAHIEKLRRAAAGRPLEILTVARDKDAGAVKAYLARHGYGFQVTMDQGPMAAALSSRKVIPLTVTVDRQGRLGQEIPGEMFEEDVMQWLNDI